MRTHPLWIPSLHVLASLEAPRPFNPVTVPGISHSSFPWAPQSLSCCLCNPGPSSEPPHLGAGKKKKKIKKNEQGWTSLVTQWVKICLPMQGTWVWSLIWEDPTCCRTTKPRSHNHWACAFDPMSLNYWRPVCLLWHKRSHRNEKPMHCNQRKPTQSNKDPAQSIIHKSNKKPQSFVIKKKKELAGGWTCWCWSLAHHCVGWRPCALFLEICFHMWSKITDPLSEDSSTLRTEGADVTGDWVPSQDGALTSNVAHIPLRPGLLFTSYLQVNPLGSSETQVKFSGERMVVGVGNGLGTATHDLVKVRKTSLITSRGCWPGLLKKTQGSISEKMLLP